MTRVDPASLDQLLHPTIDPNAERKVIATGLPASPGAASGEIVFSADEAEELKAQGTKVILVRVETSPGGHPRHARGRRHPHHARRHDLACGGGRARHGQALRLRRGRAARRLQRADHEHRRPDLQARRRHHHRRLDRAGAGRPRADDRARAVRRVRHAHGLGRQGAQARRARQCRHAERRARGGEVRRRGHRALPHRAHVLRRGPHPRGARDDPGRRREERGARRSPSCCRCSAPTSSSCSRS